MEMIMLLVEYASNFKGDLNELRPGEADPPRVLPLASKFIPLSLVLPYLYYRRLYLHFGG
jgi:hypothetical protein